MNPRLGNIGYMAIGRETTPGVAVQTTFFVPLYEESFETHGNLQRLSPIVGHKFATNQTLAGQRHHGGEVTVLGEANTARHLLNMLLVEGAVSGSNPYTRSYSHANAANGTYTVDIFTGNITKRFTGVQASKVAPVLEDNEIRLQASLAGLTSFQGRKIANVAGTVLTLSTDYDGAPTKGLLIGDLVRISKEGSTTVLDTTVSAIDAGGLQLTLGATAAAFAAGDMITLRGKTPSYDNLEPFTWANTVVGFGANHAAALANATFALHTPVEQGSNWAVMHNFENDEGSKRSGSKDPAALIRTLVDAELSIKKLFDTPEDLRRFQSLEKQACVIRHFAGSSNQYELRIGFHHIKVDKPTPGIKSGDVSYAEIPYVVQQDATDGAAITMTVINTQAT